MQSVDWIFIPQPPKITFIIFLGWGGRRKIYTKVLQKLKQNQNPKLVIKKSNIIWVNWVCKTITFSIHGNKKMVFNRHRKWGLHPPFCEHVYKSISVKLYNLVIHSFGGLAATKIVFFCEKRKKIHNNKWNGKIGKNILWHFRKA